MAKFLGIVLTLVLPIVVTVVVCWIAVHRTRSEPRRLSNAYWLLAGVILVLETLARLQLPGFTGLLGALVAMLLIAPLLLVILAVFLIVNGVTMLRRETSPWGTCSLWSPALP